MKLTLKNIGKIGKASVEINGITVIAGENDTGKSTVGRALFAVFNSFCNVEETIEQQRIDSIENTLGRFPGLKLQNTLFYNDIAKQIVSQLNEFRQIKFLDMKRRIFKLFLNYGGEKTTSFDETKFNEVVSQIKDVLNVSDIAFLNHALADKLRVEFNNQVQNILSEEDGEIQLQIKDKRITVSVNNEGTVDVQNPNNISLRTEVVYIDDPFALDELGTYMIDGLKTYLLRIPNSIMNHRQHLNTRLSWSQTRTNTIDEIIVNDKLSGVYEKISSVCSGDIITDKQSEIWYRRKGSDKALNVKNLSTGLKTFAILKTLLKKGIIVQNSAIILDEPEIHLHPEWQLIFAELIALLQKDFGVHVLLNTHSPYFLNAIETYTVKYGIDDKCKYYLASSKDDIASIEDVTNNIEAIYSTLARPLQHLENERGQLCD